MSYSLYIDDTGLNAKDMNSEQLKGEKVTFCGVLINDKDRPQVEALMDKMCASLNRRFCTTEFHFTEIYNRRGRFRNIEIDETLEIITTFINILVHYDAKIIVQTVDADTFGKHPDLKRVLENLLEAIKCSKDEKMMGLIITALMADAKVKGGKVKDIYVDEGLRKAGSSVALPITKVRTKTLNFVSSNENSMMQLADFSAWILSRAKQILNKMQTQEISEIDEEMLVLYSYLKDNYINLPQYEIQWDEAFSYDDTIAQLKEDKKTPNL